VIAASASTLEAGIALSSSQQALLACDAADEVRTMPLNPRKHAHA
jgi:hypothetical protein